MQRLQASLGRGMESAEISYFSDCILKNKEPEPNGDEGMADVRVVEAIYRSTRHGKTVKLGELEAALLQSKTEEGPSKRAKHYAKPDSKPLRDIMATEGRAFLRKIFILVR